VRGSHSTARAPSTPPTRPRRRASCGRRGSYLCLAQAPAAAKSYNGSIERGRRVLGGLTSYLQAEFARQHPEDWRCRHETPILPPDLAHLLGYAPRADVILERSDGSRRLWIEFEVSRADPVANHAKFATAHLFSEQLPTDTFVSMVSAHVNRGWRNLATNMIYVMRTMGMRAFQTTLLPHLPGTEVQRLNSIGDEALLREAIAVQPEIERAIIISEPVSAQQNQTIHLSGEPVQVLFNLRRWNDEIASSENRILWGRRTVKYFVYDARSGEFAPSKFCAYVPVHTGPIDHGTDIRFNTAMAMTIPLYSAVDITSNRLDGTHARLHLMRHLAMTAADQAARPDITQRFQHWLDHHGDSITVHPSGPVFLLPSEWLF
jgi:hypothetical protein